MSPSPNGPYVEGGSQILWENGERVFRRGWRWDDNGQRQAALIVTAATEHPSRSCLDQLNHEFELRDELGGDWAVRPLELVREAGRTLLVLEDGGGEPLERLLGAPMEMGQFLPLSISIAAALCKLHQRGLIHKDIKPANILVNGATGEVRLTGFGIASRLPRERQSPHPPETIAGTLAYMAPEQTGRMNRSIDSRSDLYALGVTFYQMLTGVLPFTAADPMEWVHCHLARRPPAPSKRLKEIPAALSMLVMKLLAKRAEERYQTAAGLERDLRNCHTGWEALRWIDEFPLGVGDTPDRLLIPEKLYGRKLEVETLLAAFDRIAQGGAPELILVSGYSGIGKSSVINELQPVLVPPRGLFASGKFDRYKNDVPYSTLAQAFQGLIRPLLGKSEADLAPWREALQEALGPNAGLILNLVPEVKFIIGESSPLPALPPQDAQRRFQLMFRRFIGVFARPEHPLALFLDDLQWLDAGTLDLLEDLLCRSDLRNLLLIGAYRDNEVTQAHPLMRKLAVMRAAGAVHDIKLAPLKTEDLQSLVAESLHHDTERAAPLADLVHEKTGGNPFFVIQFLHALADEGLLAFDHERARWSWDLRGIHDEQYTDNVLEFLAGKLTRLPLDTQDALRQLACLGNVADVSLLSIVIGTSEEQVHAVLWEALRQQLIGRLEGYYKFLHDRVQEAAYALIPETSRAETHLKIGRLLMLHTPAENRQEAIFEIVNQLNRGAPLMTSQEEREQLAELNLAAGQRAKASSAYASALMYLTAGAALLPKDAWNRRQELAFELELHSADCEVCTGALQAGEERLAALASSTIGTVQRCVVAHRRVDLCAMLGTGERGVTVALDCLRHVGIDWSAHATEADARSEYERIWSLLGNRTIEDLVGLPIMRDPDALATLDVLISLHAPATYTNVNLYALSVCRAINLSLECGNSEGAPLNYMTMALIAGARFGQYDEGYRFGKMACDLLERQGLTNFGARAYTLFSFLVPLIRPLREGIDPARRAFQMAKERGDATYAALASRALSSILLVSGHPLEQIEREAEHGLEFLRRFGSFLDRISAPLALVRMLRGKTSQFGSLDDGPFTERSFEAHSSDQPARAFMDCYYWIRKLQARFFAGDYVSAIEAAEKVEPWHAPLSLILLQNEEYHFYAALSRAACCEPGGPDSYAKHREAIDRHERALRNRGANCPQNFEDRAALVGAEIARIEGRPLDAMDLYERATVLARASGFVHIEALAYELSARFYEARGLKEVADLHLRNARRGYLRWGADGKVRQLDQRHPRLREEQRWPSSTGTIEAPVEQLDVATVIEVAQALSAEMAPGRLLDRLMRAAIEHAGAARGLLISPQSEELQIQAEATAHGEHVAVVQVSERNGSLAVALPESLIRYVTRTRETVILDDASSRNTFSTDPYILDRRARSILCLPLINQGKLAGILYLENNLTPRAFTRDRIAVLKVLASQAAISLENARLYRDLEVSERDLRSAIDGIPGLVAILAPNGEVEAANRKIAQYCGLSLEELRNWGTNGIVHHEDIPHVAEIFTRSIASGIPYEIEQRLRRFDGEYRWFDNRGVPVRDDGGRITRWYVLLTDIEDRVQALSRLEQMQSDFAHLNRVSTMGELASSLAHEILHPIATARNNARAGMRFLDLNPPNLGEAKEALACVVRDAERAKEIVGRVRDHIKKAPPLREEFDLNEALREAIFMVQGTITREKVKVNIELSNERALMRGDRIQLQQVAVNLILNAVEAMNSQEKGTKEVSIRVKHQVGGVLVQVRDSGPGIDPANFERVFEPFYTTKMSGVGMGLSICRSIISGYGGHLWVETNTPRGAVFQFTLPALRENL